MRDLKTLLRKIEVISRAKPLDIRAMISLTIQITNASLSNAKEEANLCERCSSSFVAAVERAAVSIRMASEGVHDEQLPG